jgi:sialic acid synthase SpsE
MQARGSLVVAELGVNCGGSIKIAKAIIGMCKAFGIDMVKVPENRLRVRVPRGVD